MKKIKIKKIVIFFIVGFLIISALFFAFSVMVGSLKDDTNSKSANANVGRIQIGNFLLVICNIRFDLVEESFSCIDYNKNVPWNYLPPISKAPYDEKYIQKMQGEYIGEGGDMILMHRFKGIKRGYTEITVNGTCNCDGKYRILIY